MTFKIKWKIKENKYDLLEFKRGILARRHHYWFITILISFDKIIYERKYCISFFFKSVTGNVKEIAL